MEAEIDPTTLCRYADTKDRNGTPIFENDLVWITGKGERLVEWSTENLGWMYSEKPYDDYDGYLSEIPRRNITVIGNLFYRAEDDAMKKRMYVDRQGRKYRVMGGIGPDAFKARVQAANKSGETGWKAVRYLPWRKSFPEAQRDLDELAAKKKWSVWYGEG